MYIWHVYSINQKDLQKILNKKIVINGPSLIAKKTQKSKTNKFSFFAKSI